MPAYNFQKQFVPLIESGEKYTTIRKPRKRPTQAGEVLYLYTGQRTKYCRLIGKPLAVSVREIWILRNEIWLKIPGDDFRIIEQDHAEKIARVDGFTTLESFYKWFEVNHPENHIFNLIEWKPLSLNGGQ